jgi:hypothetical protein
MRAGYPDGGGEFGTAVRKCESAKVRKCESAKVRKWIPVGVGTDACAGGAPPIPGPSPINCMGEGRPSSWGAGTLLPRRAPPPGPLPARSSRRGGEPRICTNPAPRLETVIPRERTPGLVRCTSFCARPRNLLRRARAPLIRRNAASDPTSSVYPTAPSARRTCRRRPTSRCHCREFIRRVRMPATSLGTVPLSALGRLVLPPLYIARPFSAL